MMVNGLTNMFKGVKSKGYLYKIDAEYVKTVKEKYKTDDFFVSTNDVLTAWLAEFVGSEADAVYMAIDLRERVPNVERNCAGNYLIGPPFRTDQITSPRKVRESLQAYLKPGYEWTPTTYGDFRRFGGAIHTNWTKFYHEVKLDGFEQVIHMPVIRDLGTRVGPIYLGLAICMITYVPNKGETAALIVMNHKGLTHERLRKESILGEQIMDV